ncbi:MULTISPECIES: macro domain-containing protein [Terrisporobacter]|uniref:Macro domain-containing protein n=1 Tax=Terrisporobacter muris TaxID=2963284 RepID=A0A9X2M9M2_9FIRM|nr:MULTISPECIES: macro domain-containing protein [Terrisporobacter]MCR1822560.1 macro domain-containing protein [Terrisporobacter muris]MDY3372608.1 macro domain-containing protein [Terrisporobacter othiniensis]
MTFQILHNDITKMNTDAIVNAANSKLLMGGGVCGAIFRAAGEEELQKECEQIKQCPVGHAVITKGYNLKAKYIIHTVGPIYKDGNSNEAKFLKSAYEASLKLAKDYNLKSIAFPLISSGIYGYPKKEALNIAVSTIKEFLADNDMDIYLVVFDRKAVHLSEELYEGIEHYINDFYEDENYRLRDTYSLEIEEIYHDDCNFQEPIYETKDFNKRSLERILDNIDESFSQMLLRLIDEKGKTDVEVYKKANMDRKLFSKIRSNKDYNPKKSTALSLAIGLELSLDETKDLLAKAGYTLSPSHKFDLIVEYFIKNKNYDIFIINEALFSFEQPLLAT